MTNSSLSRLQTHESDHKHKIAFLNAFYHKNEEKMKVNLTHRYNRGWTVCVNIQISQIFLFLPACFESKMQYFSS